MKIGILLCGDVAPELIEKFGNYADCLKAQLNLDRYGEVKVWNVYQEHELPEDVYECDAYVIGGSPSGVNDDLEWVHHLTLYIRMAFYAKRKLFGICFGHQVINHALGGEVKKAEKGWGLGSYDVELKQDIGELKAGQRMNLIAIHQDQVVKPGKGFEVLAGSEFCPIYITRYKNQVLTVQAHPEFSGVFFNALLMMRIERFGAVQVKQATVLDDSPIASSIFNRFAHEFLFF
ncbi:type 1 glutamine amidotransferase [Vibrio panuliri]|uniref:Glutamine amidotransferase domain-containing protein n=1 Tax=Vibrio panuliri TaxID=1381081 RepID=A0ABX3FPZ5_9VIBR|nr:type 1 glutamine amidotransferase [Vibrio panuliri]KAB1457069.1 type 1 glutamine amidotransferase [Vibrio panuliri]OLQ96098.1 hypothetical protein BIY20_20115 [Vibrio panuliri]